MTTDLILAPAPPQKPPSSFNSDLTGSLASGPYLKAEQSGLYKGAKPENFAATLQKVCGDRIPSEGSQRPISPAATLSGKADRQPTAQVQIDPESALEDVLIDAMSLPIVGQALIDDQVQLAAEFKELIALIEEMGLKNPSGKGLLLSGEGWAAADMSHSAEKAQAGLAALKQLIATIQPDHLKPGNDMVGALKQLRLIIANALAAATATDNQNIGREGSNPARPQGTLELINGGQGVAPEPEKATGFTETMAAGKVTDAEKHGEIPGLGTRQPGQAETLPREPGPIKTVENPPVSLPTQNPEKTDTAKAVPSMRAADEVNVPVHEKKVSELPDKARNPGRNSETSPLLSSADRGPRSGGEALMEKSLPGESAPVSKLINDAQTEKDNPLKGDIVPRDEAGTKVVKLEAGSNDGGQLTPQSQPSEKTSETFSLPKETEAAQREIRTQTMEQIVRRAVIQLRDGQHEARIDLKPEFLGHVRMQVITENHQVTVRIVTEFGFVKEMIENNIHQLKADLQQQGLNVDKLDVSVSRDANGNKHQNENMPQAGNRHPRDKTADHDSAHQQKQERPDRFRAGVGGLATVDYFA